MPLRLAVVLALAMLARPAAVVRFEQVLELKPSEGVFAYARISPDGRFLAYASEMPNGPRVTRTVTVVELSTKRVVFTEPGIDAYWSNDGTRLIYLSQSGGRASVAIRHHDTGAIARDVAPVSLGDYFSWSVDNGRDLIMTIESNFYYLDGDAAVLPHGRVTSCPGIGVGERPLISKDGRRITTFVRGSVVVRARTDCADVFDTGLPGGKADFSFDGRYIAFHVAKGPKAYDVVVIDTTKRTIRNITSGLSGSSLFPSWTTDGRINFRYDSADYRGFMTVTDVLSTPERPLPARAASTAAPVRWASLFPSAPAPAHDVNLVLVWSSWSAHTPDALTELQRARDQFAAAGLDVGVTTTPEISSQRADLDRLLRQSGITLPELAASPTGLASAEALNQSPTTLLFKGGRLVDRRLGAQTAEALQEWVGKY